ncbi:putative tRNA-lysidine synthase [Golovinomyces cichoracearum]|uniref:tRNA(Ile)-lysidine synthetase n=1 Tax=Golovinomyces cichoracearum TaxID=62708 RepID=A0A420I9Q4_9PEZI|nr:putative tRNA-lysidine synthase [Golovinomyces cichoracearum]
MTYPLLFFQTSVLRATTFSSRIDCNEFINSLSKSWAAERLSENRGHGARTIGLAVSGGVDSMALAVLCSNLKDCNSTEYRLLKFQAFIVDHGMRVGSSDEASSVAETLVGRGIPTKILRIKWHIEQRGYLSNFETLARKKRYRLLGQACLSHGIDSLMLAHHEDDQVETIFMRLVAGHRGYGLTGMKSQATIPECSGLYGVHESGGDIIHHTLSGQITEQKEREKIQECTAPFQKFPQLRANLMSETGGIRIYRPLLTFSKARLICTCTANEMPWFEDRTNHDPTLTTRNAIRTLYRHHKMPAALSKPALLSLSEKVNSKYNWLKTKVNFYLQMIKISSFHLATGLIKVNFPYISHEVGNSLRSEDYMPSRISVELLHKTITLVTPEERIDLSSLQGAASRVFPEICQISKSNFSQEVRPKSSQPVSFTVGGVLFQPVHENRNLAVPDALVESSPCFIKYTWLISRQPLPKISKHSYNLTIPAAQNSISPWILFDGRFWIKIVNLTCSSNLIVRFFEPADLIPFSSQFKSPVARRMLNKALANMAPGKVRWTIPIVVLSQTNSDFSQALSLPTLGIDVPGAQIFGTWKVRYKKICTDHLDIPSESNLSGS